MLNWQYFPKSNKLPTNLERVIAVFENNYKKIKSPENEFNSDKVLSIVNNELVKIGYKVEQSKKSDDKIRVPVLFGRNGKLEKYFEADAFNLTEKTVIEVEAGRGVTNYQFLKDLFQACMMRNIDYLCICVRNVYRKNPDFEKVINFFETLYASNRLDLPLKGILIIGY